MGIVTGFNQDNEPLVLWRAGCNRGNYRWGAHFDLEIVGHSDDLQVGDVVERGE